MGNRANVYVQDGDDNGVYLYTHWGGSELPEVLRDALRRGRDRWDDAQYLARIIFCEMVQDNVMDLAGYGITSRVWDGDGGIIEVDPEEQVVAFKGKTISFLEYAAMEGRSLEWGDWTA